MFRILASLLLISVLHGCAISPPSSFFAPLANNDEQPEQPQSKPEPARAKEAGLGGSISSLWDSVKSGLSFSGKTEVSAPGDSEINQLDPLTAQQLVNAYRAQYGLNPLKLNTKLAEAATKHSEDLAKNDRISHYGSDGSDTWDRVRRVGYQARMTAENVGTGQRSIGEVFKGWQNSKDHNANLLLKDAEEMGIGMVYSDKTQFKTFWTLVIGSPVAQTATN